MADLNNSQDTTSAEIVNETSGNKLSINSDGSINVSAFGSSSGKTNIGKIGTLTTTTTTADQVVLTYTVTSGKTFFLQYLHMDARRTTYPGNMNPIRLGTVSLETPSGTKFITLEVHHWMDRPHSIEWSEPMPIAAGTVIRVVGTPADTTSTAWRANFGGYEK